MRVSSLEKVTQILNLKIFTWDLCKVHIDIADFKIYVTLPGKSSFQAKKKSVCCYPFPAFLWDDDVPGTVFWAYNWVSVILQLFVLPGQQLILLILLRVTRFWPLRTLSHKLSHTLFNHGDPSRSLVDGRQWGHIMYFPQPPLGLWLGRVCGPLPRDAVPPDPLPPSQLLSVPLTATPLCSFWSEMATWKCISCSVMFDSLRPHGL